MKGVTALLFAFLLSSAQMPFGFSSPTTVPAFLWSPHYHGIKEAVNYHTISAKDLAKTVLSEGGWSNIVCSGDGHHQSVDIALIFVGRKLQSSDITKNKHVDQGLVDLLKVSFVRSNFSMAFPYIAISEEIETMENSLMSGFNENCGQSLGVSDIAFSESCSVEGGDLKKQAGLHAFQEYVDSRMQTKLKGQTDLIIFCDGRSHSSEDFDQAESEGDIFSELISFLEQSQATYTVMYASDPYRMLQYHSPRALDRFLAEGTMGNSSVNSSICDGVCQIKSSLLEGIFVGIVLLIILLSGLCCMMGIDTPKRFETPQDS